MSAEKNIWEELHDKDASWRRKIIGDINEAFVMPRYVELFYSRFGADRSLDFLEFGSGVGDISRQILAKNSGQIRRYVLSEHFEQGVQRLKELGFEAILLNACDTRLPDQSFDVTISLDVMHHVPEPRAMAREMMRVGKGRCLLVESNGLSVFRKVKELTPAHRAAGERSFTPGRWKSFFEDQPGYRLVRFEIFPFLFPLRLTRGLLPRIIKFNRWIEKVPFFRWQCSSVAIYLEYERLNDE